MLGVLEKLVLNTDEANDLFIFVAFRKTDCRRPYAFLLLKLKHIPFSRIKDYGLSSEGEKVSKYTPEGEGN